MPRKSLDRGDAADVGDLDWNAGASGETKPVADGVLVSFRQREGAAAANRYALRIQDSRNCCDGMARLWPVEDAVLGGSTIWDARKFELTETQSLRVGPYRRCESSAYPISL